MSINRIEIREVRGRIRLLRYNRAARGAKVLVASVELNKGQKPSSGLAAAVAGGVLPAPPESLGPY